MTCGAVTSSRQQAADREGVTCRIGGLSWRHRSSANSHLGLNGHPFSAVLAASGGLPLLFAPERSVLPRLSGSGAEATSSWVYG